MSLSFWETNDTRGIPSVKLNQFSRDVTDRLMFRLSRTHGVKLIALGYRDSEPQEIIKPDIPTPAVLIKFIRIRPQTWIREGETIVRQENNRIVVELMFKAYIIIKAGKKFEGEEGQDLAVALAVAVNTEAKFGHEGVGPAQLQDIKSDGYVDFNDQDEIDCKDSFVIWRVDWYHESFIGDVYTEGFYDDIQVDPQTIKEVFISFDSQEGKILSSRLELDNRNLIFDGAYNLIQDNRLNNIESVENAEDKKKLIYRGIDPNTGDYFLSNYTLIAEEKNIALIIDGQNNIINDNSDNRITH